MKKNRKQILGHHVTRERKRGRIFVGADGRLDYSVSTVVILSSLLALLGDKNLLKVNKKL
jgi:hypothetical protein